MTLAASPGRAARAAARAGAAETAAAQYLLRPQDQTFGKVRHNSNGGAEPLEIDSLFQALFIIRGIDTDMCLLKGDTVPLTLTLSALVIRDASRGSSRVTFGGRGGTAFIYEAVGNF